MWVWLSLLTLSAAPAPGDYVVTKDRIRLEKRVWSVYCDDRAPKVPSSLKKTLRVAVKGEEWTAQGAGRRFGTASCDGRNRTLAAVSRSVNDARVTIECKSERVTIGTEEAKQSVWTDGEKLHFKTLATLHFKDHGDDCVSVLRRETTLTPKDAPVADAADTPVDVCAAPGPAAVLALQPRVLSVRAGKKPVCFSVQAQDKNGCDIQASGVRFSVDPPGSAKIDDAGCVSVDVIAKTRVIGIVALAGNKRAEASARLVARAKKTLKSSPPATAPRDDLEALAAASESEVAKRVLGEVTRGAIVVQPLTGPPPALGPLEGGHLGLYISLVLLVLGLLSIVLAVVLGRRRKRAAAAVFVVTPERGRGLVCPQCEFEFAAGEASVCPFDGTRLRPHHKTVRQTMYVPFTGGMICSECHSKFPTKARFCGHDGSALVANYGQFDSD